MNDTKPSEAPYDGQELFADKPSLLLNIVSRFHLGLPLVVALLLSIVVGYVSWAFPSCSDGWDWGPLAYLKNPPSYFWPTVIACFALPMMWPNWSTSGRKSWLKRFVLGVYALSFATWFVLALGHELFVCGSVMPATGLVALVLLIGYLVTRF